MTRRCWHPGTEQRILRPALDAFDPALRAHVERDLDRLLADPFDPNLFVTEWRGTPDTTYPWRSHVALLADGRVSVRYVVFKDQPLILVISLVPIGT